MAQNAPNPPIRKRKKNQKRKLDCRNMAKPKRGMIDQITISKIDEAARIVDVVEEVVTLRKNGINYEGKCPFHDDRHSGSFMVSPSKNICRCFVCQKTWFPIQFVQDYNHWTFPETIRYLADKYGIPIETEGRTYKTPTPISKREEMRLPTMYFPNNYVTGKLPTDGNVLITYLRALPWDVNQEEPQYLEQVLHLYGVGTMTDDSHRGWTVWWQIDEQGRVRDGKVMEFLSDGHRNKANRYSITWISSLLKPYGLYNPETHDIDRCLFGLHLLDLYPEATIYIVESEKSAIIGTTRGTPGKVLFMATAGKGNLNANLLKPLMDKHRFIRLLPDHDAETEWLNIAKTLNYDRISVITSKEQGWIPEDGEKADIADILIREMNAPRNEILNNPNVQKLIETFNLEVKE